MDKKRQFGIWRFQPLRLQPMADVRCFSVFLAIYGLVIGILPMFTISQMRSLQQHFGLNDQQAQTILASSELGLMATCVIVGHFLSPLHRPRVIGLCALLTSATCFVMTLPFLRHWSQMENETGLNKYLDTDTSLCGIRPECPQKSKITDHFAYYIFITCTILFGIGSTSFYTLGITYVDDHSSAKMAPQYIGYILGLRFLASAVGLLLGTVTSAVPVHFGEVITSGSGSDNAGAWWIGYYIIGFLALVSGLPILMFPKRIVQQGPELAMPIVTIMNNGNVIRNNFLNRNMNNSNLEENARLQENEADSESSNVTMATLRRRPSLAITRSLIRDFPHALYRLVSCPAYVLLALAVTADICGAVGFFTFAPKYTESQFNSDPVAARLLPGLAIPLATSFGIIVSGKIFSQSSKSLRHKLLTAAVTAVLAYVGLPFLLAFHCPEITINQSETGRRCTDQCACAVSDFSAICGSDGMTYYSPCHAGCTDYKDDVFMHCACIQDNRTATRGHCVPQCNYGQIIGYGTVLFVTHFIAAAAMMPAVILSLRLVRPQDKNLSLAVITFIVSAFILPTPALFGALVDTTCTFHFPDNACSASDGKCAYYDKDKFRFFLHLAETGLKLASPLFLLGSWFTTKNMALEADNSERNDSEQQL